jgi:chorismate synthase
VTQRREEDKVEILSGVYEGKTTGTPIALLIRNEDQRSKDYEKIARSFRPGHADYTYLRKYGIRDPRGGGRSSARLTAPAVAAGAVAKKWLYQRYGVVVRGYLSQLGPNRVEFKSWEDVSAEGNPFFVADASRVPELEAYMDKLRKSGESVGARLTVVASGLPSGWGEPLYDRLDADIAKVMMGINAVKGVEIGAGFRSVEQLGTEHSDEMTPDGFLSNNAGGILGGISTGQDIVVSIAVKPTSSIRLPRRTIDIEGNAATIETHGRHDPCVGIRATPIAEAFVALVLIDHALRHRAQNGDVKNGVKAIQAQARNAKGKPKGDKLEDPDPLEA